MPDRMLRDGIKFSPRIDAIDDRAECAFYRLITTVDDFGVYYADPLMVRAAIWPTKSYRVAEVARVLDVLERAGLIARFSAKDGVRYLCLLRFRQRLAYGPRRRFPAPPFDEGTGEMRLELAEAPPEPSPPDKKKRSEEKGKRETPPLKISQEEWLAELCVRFPKLDVLAELTRAKRHQERAGKVLQRDWFADVWLANCSEEVDVQAARASGRNAPTTEIDTPENWRELIADTSYGPGGAFEAQSWAQVPGDVRAHLLRGILTTNQRA